MGGDGGTGDTPISVTGALFVGGLGVLAVIGVLTVVDPGGGSDDPDTPPAAASPVAPPGPVSVQADVMPLQPQLAALEANAPAPANTSTTGYVRQYRMLVRSKPTQASDVVATLDYDKQVTLVCHTTGTWAFSFTGASTLVWDKIVTPDGAIGYVSDGWVLTAAPVDRVVPGC